MDDSIMHLKQRPSADGVLNVLGTGVGAVDLDAAIDMCRTWLTAPRRGRYICVTGVHGVMEGLRDPRIRDIHNQADLCVPDGMPLTWLGRIRGFRRMDRVYGPDLMLRMLEVAARDGYTSYFYGGQEGVAEALKTAMESRFPGLRVVGTYSPPFRALSEEEDQRIVAEINRVRPDLLWMGLSTPKQERQMASFAGRLDVGLMFGVGAAFDFHTGRVRQAPAWMQRAGLEWFFRLCMEPRRLAGRYLRNNPAFILHAILQLTGLRKYPMGPVPR